MLSETDWIIRTYGKILDFKNGILERTIEINDYGKIIDTYWGGNYALTSKHNSIILVGESKCFVWDRVDYSFKEIEIQNSINRLKSHPNSDLRPFRATTGNDSNVISVLLETQFQGDSPFWADLEISSDFKIAWLDTFPKHLLAKDYPREFHQIINSGYDTPDISDINLSEKGRFVFTTGFHCAYRKYDMDYAILSQISNKGKSIGKQLKFESSFGYFSSDKKWLIIKPLYRKGETKGKMYLFNIETKSIHLLKYPRGAAKFRILDVYDNVLLLSNDSMGKYPIYLLPEGDKLKMIKINNWC